MSNLTNNARIKLSVDTSQAQQDVKLVDQQLNELGNDAGIDLGINSSDFKEFIELQKKFIGSFGDYVSSTTSSTQKIITKLEEMNSSMDKALKRDATDEYEKKLKELENKRKMMETTLQNPASGGAGNGGGGNGGGGTPSPSPSPSDGDGWKSTIKDLAGKLGGIAAVVSALKATNAYFSQGATKAAGTESQSYMTYNRTRMFGSDFNEGRMYSANLGREYGYNSADTMAFQQNYMSQTGFSSKEDLTEDTTDLMRLSKAYGLDLNATGSVAGSLVQTGAMKPGEQQRFTNMLASSIVDAEMTGRESEQLEVLNSINENLGKNTTTVGQNNLTSAMGLYDLLASSTDSLKGQRGANMVETMNDAIAGGGSKMDLLLGWGTEFTGTEGRWQLEQAKEKGISDPENLQRIIQNFEKFTPYDIDSAEGKLALKEMLNLKASEVDELMKNIDQIRSGNYSDTLEDKMMEDTGTDEVDSLLRNYKDSKVSTQEEYQVEKENAQESAGNLKNEITQPFKDVFNMLPEWAQSALGATGSAVSGVVSNPLVQAWGLSKGFKFAKGKFTSWKAAGAGAEGAGAGANGASAGAGAADDAARAAGNSVDDAARAAASSVDEAAASVAGSADDVLNAASGSVDDALNGATDALNGVDDALSAGAGSLDDVARAAAGSADDALRGASGATKALSGLSKAGKALGAAGTVIEVGTTAYDAYKAHDRGDDRTMSSEIGGGVGSVAGGWGGAAAGAAAGGAIGTVVPVIGNAIGAIVGGIIGGIGGALGGNAVGEAAGEGIYDATVGENYEFNQEQKNQIAAMYEETKRLYDEDGNNAAQKYTKETVVPYLNSIGVSTSRTKKYNWDVGKPDFMKDYESGIYTSEGKSSTHYSSSGTSHGGGGRSFAIGNDYIPYDNYPANLHKGEAVLTAREAEQYRQGKSVKANNGADVSLLDKQTKALSSITDKNSEIVNNYSALLDREDELLEKREKVYSKDSLIQSDINDPLSSIINTAYGSNVNIRQQASIQESNNVGFFGKVGNFFKNLLGFGGSSSSATPVSAPSYYSPTSSYSAPSTSGITSGEGLSTLAVGKDYIPYDGYLSELHKGEAVLNKYDAQEWRERQTDPESVLDSFDYTPVSAPSLSSGGISEGKLTIEVTGSIEGMTAENQNSIVQAVVEKIKYSDNSLMNMLNNGIVRTAH